MLAARFRHRSSGFSILEMAIVLMILGSLLSGLLVALSQVSENTRRTNAKTQLERVEEALYGFAQAYGRLPCPATTTLGGGLEDPTGGGNCTKQHGFVPNATLNLYGSINSDGLLLDPWANPLRYSVSISNGGAGGSRAFTSKNGLSAEFSEGDLTNNTMLRVCEDVNNCATTVLSDLVPAVVISMGADWATYTSASENENVGGVTDGAYVISSDDVFISTEYSEDQFDDILLWLSPYIIYSRLIEAGQLP